eukprot:7781630-Ditylum_brightwellii.AAC.1
MSLNQSALEEAERKYDNIVRYKNMLAGDNVVPTILPSDRESWVDRFYAAVDLPENDFEETKIKY